jgi:ribosomal protein S20
MANTSSAKKAIRSSAKKKLINDNVRTKVREARIAVIKAVAAGEKKAKLSGLLSTFSKQVDKAAKSSSRVYSKNKAARLKSKMAVKVGAVS